MFRVANWYFIFILLVIPVLVYLEFVRRKTYSISYSSIKSIQTVFKNNTARDRIIFALRLLSLTLLIIAFARPQKGLITRESITRGIDIMLCLDTSTSMRALDFKPKNRFDAAKEAAIEFVKLRKNDNIGIVVYSGLAFTQCPLTTDHQAVLQFLDKAEIGMTQLDGTAIGTAIITSIARLKDSQGKSKIIVLLTDGRNNMGEIDPITAAKAAQSADIKIYTVGAGAPGKALYPVEHPIFGLQYVYLPEELDEGTLKQIAQITGGRYFRVRNRLEMLEAYRQIDKLEKTEIKMHEFREYNELFKYFVLAGLIIYLTEFFLERVILKKIP
ncbi:MAG: VWA domain-containing protein [Elusimicrobiota bacterium]|nr:VWA domain-containing protein [Elusimicrobiota bacterium]